MRRTIEILFGSLTVLTGEDDEPQSLERLDVKNNMHLHGGLYINVEGRMLPHLGYWSATDVCFNDWTVELEAVYQAFMASETGEHIYDEGEQGQPAFVFKRTGAKGWLSVAESNYNKGTADPDWQNVEFLVEDFFVAYQQFKSEFITAVKEGAPAHGAAWISKYLPPGYSIL